MLLYYFHDRTSLAYFGLVLLSHACNPVILPSVLFQLLHHQHFVILLLHVLGRDHWDTLPHFGVVVGQ
eukprot:5867765-Prymnesium_polylepis.1